MTIRIDYKTHENIFVCLQGKKQVKASSNILGSRSNEGSHSILIGANKKLLKKGSTDKSNVRIIAV